MTTGVLAFVPGCLNIVISKQQLMDQSLRQVQARLDVGVRAVGREIVVCILVGRRVVVAEVVLRSVFRFPRNHTACGFCQCDLL